MPEQSSETAVSATVSALQEPQHGNAFGRLQGHRVELFGHERANNRVAFPATSLRS